MPAKFKDFDREVDITVESSPSQVDLSLTSSELASEVDVGYGYFVKGEEKQAKRGDDDSEGKSLNRRILKKIDMRILPIMYVLSFFFPYLTFL